MPGMDDPDEVRPLRLWQTLRWLALCAAIAWVCSGQPTPGLG